MPFHRTLPSLFVLLALSTSSYAADEIIIDDGSADAGASDGELIIDGGDVQIDGDDVQIDGGDTGTADITIDDSDAPQAAMAEDDAGADFSFGLDEARIEYGHFTDSDSATDSTMYGHLSAKLNWRPAPSWEVQLAGRVDGFDEDQEDGFSTVRGDYGDSFVRYRGDDVRLTLGSQTVIWGRLDELPLSDRVSSVDASRLLLDDLEYRRRSTPMLRAEAFVAGGKLDLVWLYDFREAEMPDKGSVWYPVDRRRGRVLGIDPGDIPVAAIRASSIDDDEPSGDGGGGMRFTRAHSFADIGITAARTRQSIPYFRVDGPTRLKAEYPRSWTFGVDAAMNAADATWRIETVYNSDVPVTRDDLRYTTVESLQWGAGVEFHPGDSDSRVNLQLVGMNLIDAPKILDRSETYSVNGEIEVPFDRERWRADVDFYFGIDAKDVYINPEIAFLGWEPHELYLAAHYFDGDDNTLGGFYEDQSLVTLGWRAKF